MTKERWDPEAEAWVSHEQLLKEEKLSIEQQLQKAADLPRTKLHELEHRLEEIDEELREEKDGGTDKRSSSKLVQL